MSYNTLTVQVRDVDLQSRVNAAAHQEAAENANVADTALAASIRSTMYGAETTFIWDVALATEAEYASALAAGNPAPGSDEAVISDGMILSAVQATWADHEPAPTP